MIIRNPLAGSDRPFEAHRRLVVHPTMRQRTRTGLNMLLVLGLVGLGLVLLWIQPEWSLNDEVFFLVAMAVFAFRDKKEGQMGQSAAADSNQPPSRRSVDWVLVAILAAFAGLSLETVLSTGAPVLERSLASLNIVFALAFLASTLVKARPALKRSHD